MPEQEKPDPLEEALREAGLPTDREVIGQLYRFDCSHGSHREILVGSVKALGLSDEGGLALYVTSPTFWGEPLVSIQRRENGWVAYKPLSELSRGILLNLKVSAEEVLGRAYFEGDFRLL